LKQKNLSKVDLHIHSNFSADGEFPVAEILAMCKAQEMELVSITDHNSVKSADEILKNNMGLRVISGVELDCNYADKILHLLGYGVDHTLDEFAEIESEFLRKEREAASERIRLFQEFIGIPLDAASLIASSKNGFVTAEQIGEHIFAKKNISEYKVLRPYLPGGEKSDMPNVHLYWDFFAPGKPADVPIQFISLREGIELIHRANGIAVLAHPGQLLKGNYATLDKISAEGLDGVEVFSSYHSAEEAAYFLNFAKNKKLFISCGSDFHGKNKPPIKLGGHESTIGDHELLESFKVLGLPFL
jgi:predicted metal-dependent phosphoesterase TrpH